MNLIHSVLERLIFYQTVKKIENEKLLKLKFIKGKNPFLVKKVLGINIEFSIHVNKKGIATAVFKNSKRNIKLPKNIIIQGLDISETLWWKHFGILPNFF